MAPRSLEQRKADTLELLRTSEDAWIATAGNDGAHLVPLSMWWDGEVLTMTVEWAEAFRCEVIRSDWHQDKNMFVIACRYAKRSISDAEYQAFLNAPDWHRRALL